jgi:hypothetical protein
MDMMADEDSTGYIERTNSAVVLNSYENGIHDVILQGLDQALQYGDAEVYYPADSFKDSIERWQGIPLVYVPDGRHIPVDEFNADPETALQQYDAVPIGNIQEPEIMEEGQRRLQAKAAITNAEYDERIKAGEIQISTSFLAPGTNQIQSPVMPSYVLAFDKNTANPRDKLTMFLNSERDQSHNNTEENKHMSETEAAVKMATLERDLSDKEKAIERMNTEVQQKDEKVSELETAVERLNTEKSEVEAKLEQAEKQLTEFANAEENRQWQNIKDNYIPPGMIADESKESSMRELYNTDKDQFWMKVAKANAERPPETHREGNEFSNTSGNSALEKEMSDLGISIDVEE